MTWSLVIQALRRPGLTMQFNTKTNSMDVKYIFAEVDRNYSWVSAPVRSQWPN